MGPASPHDALHVRLLQRPLREAREVRPPALRGLQGARAQAVKELTSIEDAVALLDEWTAAYNELLRKFRRLEVRCHHAEDEVKSQAFLLKHLDPFLPRNMQDAKARAAEPRVYDAIAELLAEQNEYNPFP
jgi:hypothetical protein